MTPCLEVNAGQNAAQWLKNVTWDVNRCDRLPRCSNHHDALYNSALLTNYTHKRRLSDCLQDLEPPGVSIRSDRLSENGWHDCGLNDSPRRWLTFVGASQLKKGPKMVDFWRWRPLCLSSLGGVKTLWLLCPPLPHCCFARAEIMEQHYAVCRQRLFDSLATFWS